jgi:aryl-alcohol dehydrogenase-like predicted oxidoreductase
MDSISGISPADTAWTLFTNAGRRIKVAPSMIPNPKGGVMEYTRIPGTRLEASRIAIGTWAIGGWMWGGTDEDESVDTLLAALDQGVNLIDTAPVYGFGRAEEIVGKAIRAHGRRERLIISTKGGIEWKNGRVFRNSEPPRLAFEVEDSLRRLGTDYIDLYFVHWPDPLVPFEETGRLLQALCDQGKIRAIGVSNYASDQMSAFREAAALHVCQPPYNIFERQIETDTMPYCREHGIALMTYGALCRGLLSGKMSSDREFPGDDLRNTDPKFQPPRFDRYLKAAARLEQLAKERFGKDLLPAAVRWILDQGVEIAIWGGRRPDQMRSIEDVFGWRVDREFLMQVEEILAETIDAPVGPEFMAPPTREGT